MAENRLDRVLEIFRLNDKQKTCALERERDVVVTAGAGSGKTLTLVARYTGLLAEGISPRRIAAITFTKKAAREMRSRVRSKLTELQQIAETENERQKWVDLSAQMDSARIGTIHSLCSEILRGHPAEAKIDPLFEVIDEGETAALRNQVVEETLNSLVEQENYLPLLMNISLNNISQILLYLLERRLDAEEIFNIELTNLHFISKELRKRMESPSIKSIIDELRVMTDSELVRHGGDNLAGMVKELLSQWAEAENALLENNPISCAISLYQARRSKMKRNLGKRDGYVKGVIASLQEQFDKLINPLTGGKNTGDPLPSAETESLFESLLPLLRDAFESTCQAYQAQLENRQALDFDDLENGALQLLRQDEIRARWQNELDALLVDEFQDTNPRQREIIQALVRSKGGLFIVGDMRQSIYRFRQADVTVFREEQNRIQNEDGLVIDLEKTYRAHELLLLATGDLLAEVIGTVPDPERKYYIHYTPLEAKEKKPHERYKPPHVEFVIGVGDETETARLWAAQALAERLLQLKNEDQIMKWDDVALLFRASTGFSSYEEALEEAGIPFLTGAGRGFYDRPEIRDLINIVRALADPVDDLSFAGLLRSPAFGLSDAGLFLLRRTNQSFWAALHGDLSFLSEADQFSAARTRQIVSSLLPLVDRVLVGELLKRVVDAVDYRAILATADLKTGKNGSNAGGGRLWRNLDKLLDDAQMTSQITVNDFLDRLKVMNDAGAREGEAPAEAEGSVCLMTIHKAKGLEFPVVILADAGRETRAHSEQVYLSKNVGVTFKLDPPPMLYNLAKAEDKDQDLCEELRLIYVAMTRAKSKLIISAHALWDGDETMRFRAWSKKFFEAIGVAPEPGFPNQGEPIECLTSGQQPMRIWISQSEIPFSTTDKHASEQHQPSDTRELPLYRPIVEESGGILQEEFIEVAIGPDHWLATQQDDYVPGDVLGKMVHKAIQNWLFPGNPNLKRLLETEAIHAGLAFEKQRQRAESRALELLERFHKHPIWMEIDGSEERYFELPYTSQVDSMTDIGYIDLLYRNLDGWHILDFKTDPISSASQRELLIKEYRPQFQRYSRAVEKFLGVKANIRLCFLDDRGAIGLINF